MKTLYFLILSFLISTSSIAQTWNWAKSVSNNGPDKGNAITYDGQGNIYVAANFYTYFGSVVIDDSTITNNALIKYSKTGSIIWALNINGFVTDIATDVSGNIYLAGMFENTAQFGDSVFTSLGQMDVFAAKVSPAGKFIWAKHAGGTGYDECYGINVGGDSNVVVAAFPAAVFTIDDTIINPVGGGVLLINYKLNGNFSWAKMEGHNNKAYDIVIDSDKNILVSGFFSFSSDFGGSITIPANNNSSFFVAKYNSAGNFLWVKTGISGGNNNAQKLVLDVDNNVYVTGYFEDTVDFGNSISLISNTSWEDIFVAKYNSNGQIQWAKREGTYDLDIANAITLQGNHVFITGIMGIDYPSETDVFVRAYDLNGNYVMSVHIDSTDNNSGNAITADDDGNIYITGQFQNTLKFNNSISITSYATSDYDFYVAKLIPAFSPQSIQNLSDNINFNAYPNPACDIIKLDINNPNNADLKLNIYNVIGKIIRSEMLMQNQQQINIEDLANGIYFIEIKSKELSKKQKLIIQR